MSLLDRRWLLALLLAAAAGLAVAASPYVRRVAGLRMADVYDYYRLPYHTIPASERPCCFAVREPPIDLDALGLQWDGRAIEDAAAFLEGHGTTSFLVIVDFWVLWERCFNDHARDSLCKSSSVTKSFLSVLVGTAPDRGELKDLDTPVTEHVPALRDADLKGVTLRHCLTNRAGFHYTQGMNPWADRTRVYYTKDVRTLLAGLRLAQELGSSLGGAPWVRWCSIREPA